MDRVLISSGSSFHNLWANGAAAENALSPYVFNRVFGTCRRYLSVVCDCNSLQKLPCLESVTNKDTEGLFKFESKCSEQRHFFFCTEIILNHNIFETVGDVFERGLSAN